MTSLSQTSSHPREKEHVDTNRDIDRAVTTCTDVSGGGLSNGSHVFQDRILRKLRLLEIS